MMTVVILKAPGIITPYIHLYFQKSEKIFDYLCTRTFFLPTFQISRPCDFSKIEHSHFTPKGAPACVTTSKSYDWDLRKLVKISPKMTK